MKIKLGYIIVSSFIAIILIYAFINTSALRRPPVIKITSPSAYSTVSGSVEVSGTIKHVKEATINGRQITFSTRGDFKELVILRAPTDTIDIVATGAYGKVSKKSLLVNVSD